MTRVDMARVWRSVDREGLKPAGITQAAACSWTWQMPKLIQANLKKHSGRFVDFLHAATNNMGRPPANWLKE